MHVMFIIGFHLGEELEVTYLIKFPLFFSSIWWLFGSWVSKTYSFCNPKAQYNSKKSLKAQYHFTFLIAQKLVLLLAIYRDVPNFLKIFVNIQWYQIYTIYLSTKPLIRHSTFPGKCTILFSFNESSFLTLLSFFLSFFSFFGFSFCNFFYFYWNFFFLNLGFLFFFLNKFFLSFGGIFFLLGLF